MVVEGTLGLDARAVDALYRLTRALTEAKEGDDADSLLGILAEALFETFPNATHVMVAKAGLGDGETEDVTVRLRTGRRREGASSLEAEIPFSRSLIRKALVEQSWCPSVLTRTNGACCRWTTAQAVRSSRGGTSKS